MTRCDWLLQLDAKDDLFACWRPVEAVLDVLSLCLAVAALLQLDAKDDLFACWRPREAVSDLLRTTGGQEKPSWATYLMSGRN